MIKIIGLLIMLAASGPGWAMPLEIIPGDLGSFELRVRLSVDGVERDFQLDTGADSTIVTPDDQTREYVSLGKTPTGGASGVRVECDWIEPSLLILDSLKIASPRFKRCDFGDHKLNNLGMNILSGFSLAINSREKSLDFIERIPPDLPAYPIERLKQGHIRFRIHLMESPIGAIFDTGAQLTSIDLRYVNDNRYLFHFLREVDGRDITGALIKMELYEIPRLRIGGIDFQNVQLLAFDFQDALRAYFGADTPLIIGNNIILQTNWIIDLKSYQWAALE